VKELLAPGGFSAVYRAHDPAHGRDVAIKIVKQEAYKKFTWIRKAFRLEAELLTKLVHPGLPDCYDYVEEADQVYMVLEFITGKRLDEMLEEQEGFLPEQSVIQWGIQICDILIHLHSPSPEPIIHRDLKPQNMIVKPDGRLVVVDLGIQEAYRPGREMAMIGPEGYAPPEQYVGYTDTRSDIYALGATLHHLLTRRDPRGEKLFSFHGAPPRSLNPTISEDLEAVILKAVEYRAKDRFQTVEEMKAALLACLGREQ
jgi:serine/threonine protein kinase